MIKLPVNNNRAGTHNEAEVAEAWIAQLEATAKDFYNRILALHTKLEAALRRADSMKNIAQGLVVELRDSELRASRYEKDRQKLSRLILEKNMTILSLLKQLRQLRDKNTRLEEAMRTSDERAQIRHDLKALLVRARALTQHAMWDDVPEGQRLAVEEFVGAKYNFATKPECDDARKVISKMSLLLPLVESIVETMDHDDASAPPGLGDDEPTGRAEETPTAVPTMRASRPFAPIICAPTPPVPATPVVVEVYDDDEDDWQVAYHIEKKRTRFWAMVSSVQSIAMTIGVIAVALMITYWPADNKPVTEASPTEPTPILAVAVKPSKTLIGDGYTTVVLTRGDDPTLVRIYGALPAEDGTTLVYGDNVLRQDCMPSLTPGTHNKGLFGKPMPNCPTYLVFATK